MFISFKKLESLGLSHEVLKDGIHIHNGGDLTWAWDLANSPEYNLRSAVSKEVFASGLMASYHRALLLEVIE